MGFNGSVVWGDLQPVGPMHDDIIKRVARSGWMRKAGCGGGPMFNNGRPEADMMTMMMRTQKSLDCKGHA